MLRRFFSISALFITALLAASVSFAKNINLYEQPKTDAKVVATIDPAQGIVPIYTPDKSEWVKIGDPRNGNVGWVKSSDLAKAGAISTGFSFTQQISNGINQPESLILKFGGSELTVEQQQRLKKQIETQRIIFQNGMQQLMQDIYRDTGIFVPIVTPSPSTNTSQTEKK